MEKKSGQIKTVVGALLLLSAGGIGSVAAQENAVAQEEASRAMTGADASSVFTARRGIERVLFWVTIVLSFLFFALAIAIVVLAR